MDKSKLLAALYTVVLVAAWGFVSALAVYNFDVFSMGSSDWRGVAVAVLSAVGALVTNWLNPRVTRYGIGSGSAESGSE